MPKKLPVCVQLYTVRDECAEDFPGTLKSIKEIGYAGVELAGLNGYSAAEVKKFCDDLGLIITSAHVPLEAFESDLDQVAADYTTLGVKYVVVPWLAEDRRQNLAGYATLGATLAEYGKKLSAHGLSVGYHNHDFEYKTKEGDTYGLDTLFGAGDPANLKVELDTYWVKKGGADIAAEITKYAGRIPLIHLKDMAEDGFFAPVGTGTVDYTALFAAAEAAGSEYYIVEQDSCREQSPLESIKISFDNLVKMGVV
jgi:sugar phosphate isomerase/epimerase